MVFRVTSILENRYLNIAFVRCDMNAKGKEASMGICLDGYVPDNIIDEINKMDDVYLIRKIEVLKK